MTIAQEFNKLAVAHGGTADSSGTIAGAIDALNDALAGSDQPAAQTIEEAVKRLGEHIGGGSVSGTIEITENGEGIDVAQYAYADVNVSGGGGGTAKFAVTEINASDDSQYQHAGKLTVYGTQTELQPIGSFEDNGYTYRLYEADAGSFIEYEKTYEDGYLIDGFGGYYFSEYTANLEDADLLSDAKFSPSNEKYIIPLVGYPLFDVQMLSL